MDILEIGKLKSDFLEGLLGKIDIDDEKVVIGPGVGEDAAVIDMGNNYLIVKSDPITFVSERIGWYVVNVNANDIASMGGVPRWFLVTMLLPQRKTTVNLIEKIMYDLRESCAQLGIALIGGHTEITHGLENPILAGTMLGEVGRENLITNRNIREGDLLYMTKGVAIEATSIIARERKNDIVGHFGEAFYKRCLLYLEDPGISVVSDAQKINCTVRVTGMHDPTEGGVLAGAYEMARASDRCLDIYIDSSGSMPNPISALSYLTLAGVILAISALRAGAKVQVTVWSGYGQFASTYGAGGFIDDEKTLLKMLCKYFGNGTGFPLNVLRDTYNERKPDDPPVHIIVISDDGVDTMLNNDEKNTPGKKISQIALEKGRGGGTLLLNLPSAVNRYAKILKLKEIGYDIYRVTNWKELVTFAREFSEKTYGDL